MVPTTMVAEGEGEEISIKEAGRMEGVEEEEEVTKMVVIKVQVSSWWLPRQWLWWLPNIFLDIK